MGVRAKMYVAEKTEYAAGGAVKLHPVCRGEDNKEWSQATPSGECMMRILNSAALDQFTVGAEYFVDFTPVPDALKGQEGMG